jgi:hypothetical protein
MTNKYMKRCITSYITSLAIKEMQTKTTLRFHLVPVRIAIIKQKPNWVQKFKSAIPATWKAEIGRIMVQGQPGQKGLKISSQWPGMVMCTHHH